MQIAILEIILGVLLTSVAVLGIVGFILTRREKKRGEQQTQKARDDTENAVNLNDRFNRARSMSEDGK